MLGIDFTSQDFFRDPLAALERLRAAGPVVEVGLPITGRVWMTTTQEMASRVLKDNQVFTLRKDDGAVAGLRWWMPSIFRVFASTRMRFLRMHPSGRAGTPSGSVSVRHPPVTPSSH